ncbi:MAG: DNRLRE domain-containing protein, partial [Anaerolineae bacterium]|nr:DNRLRE domain-containing protein [Anaerolineae bacterium]
MKSIRMADMLLLTIAILVLAFTSLHATATTENRQTEAEPETVLAPDSTEITLTPVVDTYVYEGSPGTNYNTSATLAVGRNEFLQEAYALLRFDLSSIPAGSVIHSAQFKAYLIWAQPGSVSICVHRVTSSWNSPSVTWNTRPTLFGSCYSPTSVGTTTGIYYTWADV